MPSITNIAIVGGYPRLVIESDVGVINQTQWSTNLNHTNWFVLTNLMTAQNQYSILDVGVQRAPQNFYRVLSFTPPTNIAFVPTGSFVMGDSFSEGGPAELPLHTNYLSAFCIDKYEVTESLWDDVFAWATNRPGNLAYDFENIGCWKDGIDNSRGPNNPVDAVNWYDMVKWCNARSEMEGLVPAYYTSAGQTNIYRTGRTNVDSGWVKWNAGYRLPTEAEWEKAARGGANGHRFPWSDADTIAVSRANYSPSVALSYDLSYPGSSWCSDTCPVGNFAANGYGLYDVAGNLLEWCWDSYGSYSSDAQSDPRGPIAGPLRVIRGGNFAREGGAGYCRVAWRSARDAGTISTGRGFRCVLPLGQP